MALALQCWSEQGGMAPNRADQAGINAAIALLPFATAGSVRAPMGDAPGNSANEAGAIEKELAMHR